MASIARQGPGAADMKRKALNGIYAGQEKADVGRRYPSADARIRSAASASPHPIRAQDPLG